MNSFIKKQYKMHIARNLSHVLTFIVVYIIAINCLMYGMGLIISSESEQLEAKEKLGYTYVVESNKYTDELLSYYKLDYLVTIEAFDGKIIHTNFYVDIRENLDSKSVLTVDKLKDGQIEISRKVAEKLGVTIGDELYVNLSIFDESQKFIIANISDYIDDFYEYSDDSDFSVAAIPYSKSIIENSRGKYVGFYNNEEYLNFYNNDKAYSAIYNVSAEFQNNKIEIVIWKIVCIFIFALISIAFVVITHKVIFIEIRKYYIAGIGYQKVKRLHQLDKILFQIVPTIISFIPMLIGTFVNIVPAHIIMVAVPINIVLLIVVWMWKEGYEKTD